MWARTYTDLLGNYFVDKHHLIHLNASPPMLDERLAKWVEKVLPIGVCIHSVFVALSYTGDASVALMITMSCLSIGGLLFFECWESCKDEEPPQDINMAIPCVVQCLILSAAGATVPVPEVTTGATGFTGAAARLTATPSPLVYVINRGEQAEPQALTLARTLRGAGLAVELDGSSAAFGKQFKRADRSGAPWAVVLGDEEAQASQLRLKPLRAEGEEQQLSWDETLSYLTEQR